MKSYFTFGENESIENMGYESVIADIEAREKVSKMEKYLNKLPIKQREVFIMRNYDDLSYDEISSITGKSVGALKANYFHAFKKMKELMEKDEYR